jgi:hypothetical protein
MTCERRYTSQAIAEMHAIAQLANLRRRVNDLVAYRKQLPLTEYGSGFVDGLDIVLGMIMDYSRCDNPPVEGE